MRKISEDSADIFERALAEAEGRASVTPVDVARYSEGEDDDFDVSSIKDARKRIVRAICRRQGQQSFRKKLLHAYERRCAVSGCRTEHVLEAAHIIPYQGARTNHAQHGILLRGDIHTLFDLNLIKVSPKDYRIEVDPGLRSSEYQVFNGKKIRLPKDRRQRPDIRALRERLNSFLRRSRTWGDHACARVHADVHPRTPDRVAAAVFDSSWSALQQHLHITPPPLRQLLLPLPPLLITILTNDHMQPRPRARHPDVRDALMPVVVDVLYAD